MTGLLLYLFLAANETAQQWLEAADGAREAFQEAIISARASQVVGGNVTGSADFDIYRKGRDKGLIIFQGGKNAGRKILTVGDKMWLIVPGASNPVPITPNQRLMGGASIADVARLRFVEDYTASLRPETESINGKSCRVLDLTARSPKAAFPHVVLWVDDAEKLPVRVLFSLPSGKEAKDVTFTKFGKAAGKTVVTEMEIRDLLAADPGTVTRLEYTNFRRARLDDQIFTPDGAKGL